MVYRGGLIYELGVRYSGLIYGLGVRYRGADI